MRDIDGCRMDEVGTVGSSEKAIALLGDRWWPQAAEQEGISLAKSFYGTYGNDVVGAETLEVSRLGVGTVLHLEREAWSVVK